MVRLHNGAEESIDVIVVTMMSLQELFWNKPVIVYELVMLARDPSHQLYANTSEVLQQLALVEAKDRMDDSVRNVVLSAVDGEGIDMILRNPVIE